MEIDRPLGSKHPSGGFTYEVKYGFVAGYIAPDGEELDAYVLGPAGPVECFEGTVVAVVLRSDDIEDKLVIAEVGRWNEIASAIAFRERFFTSTVIT